MQAVQVGMSATINCGQMVLDWTFNNQTLSSDATVSRTFMGIWIRNVQIHHNGIYRCRIADDVGQKEVWEASVLYVGG